MGVGFQFFQESKNVHVSAALQNRFFQEHVLAIDVFWWFSNQQLFLITKFQNSEEYGDLKV